MSITPQFMTAVNNGDITYVRVMLKNEILLSAENGSFEEMFTYASTHMNGLIDVHDGEVFEEDDAWNKDYMNKQMVRVMDNFSKERIELLQKIVRKLYGKQQKTGEGARKVSHQYDQSRSQSFDRSEFQFDDLPFWVKIGAGAIVVALALLMGRR